MANTHYYEQLADERTERTRQMLLELPVACTDFINSITMTTSPLTRMAYTIDFGTFCEYACKEIPYFADKMPREWTDDDFAQISAKDLRGFSDYLTLYLKDSAGDEQRILRNHECGVMRKLSSLRSFFDFLFRAERIPGNIAALVSLPKVHEKPILYLINDEVERLLEAVSEGEELTDCQKKYHQLTRTRDIAILMLFLGTGIRVSECVGIDLDDLDFHLNAVLVTRKGGNQVILYYPPEVAQALQNYLVERKKIDALPEHRNALFLSLQRKRIGQRAVQLMVKKYCAIAVPLKKRMSPHKLRSTYATRLYNETEDIYLVADALGHSDVNTTRKHYAAISDKRRREAAKNVYLPTVPEHAAQSDEES